jgi:hypothetical protein
MATEHTPLLEPVPYEPEKVWLHSSGALPLKQA